MAKRTTVITLADGHYWHCAECDTFSEESGGNLYECGECGTFFTRANSAADNHQCGDCMKFGARTGDQGCIDCGEAPVEQVAAAECTECGEIVEGLDDDRCDDCEADADWNDDGADDDDGEAEAEAEATESIADRAIKMFWVDGIAVSEIAATVKLPTKEVKNTVYGQRNYCYRMGWLEVPGE